MKLIRGGLYGAVVANERKAHRVGPLAFPRFARVAPAPVPPGGRVVPLAGRNRLGLVTWEHIGVTVVRVLGRILSGGAVAW